MAEHTAQTAPLAAADEDILRMLSCSVHLGAANLTDEMQQYVWKRRADGIYIINLGKTWEKLMLAARVIATIEHPKGMACPWFDLVLVVRLVLIDVCPPLHAHSPPHTHTTRTQTLRSSRRAPTGSAR